MAQSKGAHAYDESVDPTPLFTAWFANWPDVRRELETLLAAYEQRHPAYDPGWTEPVFEMMDSTLSNLSYRAQWLKTNLDRQVEDPAAESDNTQYTLLAEGPVG